MRKLHIFSLLISLSLVFACASFVDRPSGLPKLDNVQWKNKNIIVVLGMRTERTDHGVVLPKLALPRVREAERLYRQCKLTGKICLILASGGDPAENGVTEAELIKRTLVENQVQETHVLIEGQSVSTYHNAKYSSELLRKEAPDVTVLVTSDIHLNRALKMFKMFNVFPLPAPAEVDAPKN